MARIDIVDDESMARRVTLSKMRVEAFNTILAGVVILLFAGLFCILSFNGKISVEAVVGMVGTALGTIFRKHDDGKNGKDGANGTNGNGATTQSIVVNPTEPPK